MLTKVPYWGLKLTQNCISGTRIAKKCPQRAQCRQLSSKSPGGYREPSYLVDTEVRTVSPSEIKVPYLSEKLKQEMYGKYKQNPEEWSVMALSKAYGSSIERTKAVLLLLERRESFKKERGILDMPSEWMEIHKKHEEYKNAPPPVVEAASKPASSAPSVEVTASEGNASGDGSVNGEGREGGETATSEGEQKEEAAPAAPQTPLQRVASEFGKSESAVQDILDKVDEHVFRQGQVDAYEAHMERIAEKLSDRGVDTTFRETGGSASRSVTDDYYPALFGDDDGFEKARVKLIADIEKETKATVTEDVDARPAFLRDADSGGSSKYELPAEMPNGAKVETTQLSRWKFAFKDLSKPKDFPTMVRTRRGAWRQATPLEEATRSWLKNPSPLDRELYKEQTKHWEDFDGDLEAASRLSTDKLARRKALKQQQQQEAE